MEKRNYFNNYNIVAGCPNVGGNKPSCNNDFSVEILDKTPLVPKNTDGVLSFRNSYEASERFWSEANRQGIFSLMYMFSKLKYRNTFNPINTRCNPFNDTELNKAYFTKLKDEVNVNADLTGGFIKRKQLSSIAKKIGYSENTLRINLGKLTRLGFIIKTETGWRMISITKVALMLGVELKKLRIKADTKNDLKEKHAYSIIKRTKHKQDKVKDETNRKISGTLSCKTLANKLGYKSAMTGSNREHKLESKQRLVVQRHRVVKTKLVDSLSNEIVIWKRPCNVLNPISKVA